VSDHSTPGDGDDGSDGETLSTAEYVRLTMLNRVSLLGLAVAVLGGVVVVVTSPTGPFPTDAPLVGGGILLAGVLVFALGFTIGQRALGARDDW
jgi:drug/metabolite transporter (DMT)-like permease